MPSSRASRQERSWIWIPLTIDNQWLTSEGQSRCVSATDATRLRALRSSTSTRRGAGGCRATTPAQAARQAQRPPVRHPIDRFRDVDGVSLMTGWARSSQRWPTADWRHWRQSLSKTAIQSTSTQLAFRDRDARILAGWCLYAISA